MPCALKWKLGDAEECEQKCRLRRNHRHRNALTTTVTAKDSHRPPLNSHIAPCLEDSLRYTTHTHTHLHTHTHTQARKASAQQDGTSECVRGLGNVDVSTSARVLVCKHLEQVCIPYVSGCACKRSTHTHTHNHTHAHTTHTHSRTRHDHHNKPTTHDKQARAHTLHTHYTHTPNTTMSTPLCAKSEHVCPPCLFFESLGASHNLRLFQ